MSICTNCLRFFTGRGETPPQPAKTRHRRSEAADSLQARPRPPQIPSRLAAKSSILAPVPAIRTPTVPAASTALAAVSV